MDVEHCAPFTSSPLDASRGRGRRLMIPRMRSLIRRPGSGDSTPTVVVFLSPPASAPLQQTIPQLGASSNGKNTK